MIAMNALVQAPPAPDRPAWLDPRLYPYVPRSFEVEGGRMAFLDEGRGAPLLFVHGTPSWSFEWRHAIAALRSDHRCVAPDHLGFGLSDKPTDGAYRPADHARRLLALVRALDLRETTLVVHDFGGPIGLAVAREEPERFRSVVVVNSWMWGLADQPRVARLSRLVASPLGRFLYLRLAASPRWLLPASFADRTRLTRAIHRHYLGPFPTPADRVAPWVLGRELAASHAFYESLWRDRARLPPVSALIWGMADPTFGAAELGRFAEAFPEARVVSLPGVGHFPQEEAPDALAAVLRELSASA